MKQVRVLASIVLCCLLVNCSEPRVDGSTQENVQNSLFEMYRGLSTDDRDKLERAVAIVASDGECLESMSLDEVFAMPRPRANVDGLTAAEILSRAEEIEDAFYERKAQEEALKTLIKEQFDRANILANELSDLREKATVVGCSKAIEILADSGPLTKKCAQTIGELSKQVGIDQISEDDFVAGVDAAIEEITTKVVEPTREEIAETVAESEANRKRALERRNRALERRKRIAHADGIREAARESVLEKYNQTPTKSDSKVEVEWELMDFETKFLTDFDRVKGAFVKGQITQSAFDRQVSLLTATYKTKSFDLIDESRR